MKFFAILFAVIAVAYGFTDPECANYEHSNYGCVGQCVSTGSCPGSMYISSLCPTQANDIKCCFTADSDAECATYQHWSYGQVGSCISTSQCPSSNYISNLCPSKPGDVKCCFSKPTETCTGGSCSAAVQTAACTILDYNSQNKVYLLDNNGYLNSKGNNDGADAYSNIRDTCNGGQAKLSSYCCGACAPGGYTCLSERSLNYIIDLVTDGHYLQINCLAGACHSSNSWHYAGTAVDFQILSGSNYEAWMSECSSHGAQENLGPGNAGHDTHTHCAFSS